MSNVFPATFLRIDGVAILARYAEQIKQTYGYAPNGEILPLQDGSPFSTHRDALRKFKTTITGNSIKKPSLESLWQGKVVRIDWAAHFDETGYVDANDLRRESTEGSLKYVGENQVVNGRARPTLLPAGSPGILVTTYRPTMLMMIQDISVDEDTAAPSVSWTIEATEL